MRYAIGIDLGGTNIAAGLVDQQYHIVQRGSIKTNVPRSAEAICRDMAQLCASLASQAGLSMADISSVGVGTAGIVWGGEIETASNLALHHAPIATLLSGMIGKPVYVENDANAAAYGEYIAGSHPACRSMILMTIGTGIGTGMILDGKIYAGFNGAAAELGHTILVPGGRLCPCGKRGCFETYCSATGLVATTREAMRFYPQSKMWDLCEGSLDKVQARTAFLAQDMEDEASSYVLDHYLDYLAIGVANTVNLLQPEVFCIGGGVSLQGDSLLMPLKKRVEALAFAGSNGIRTRLVLASLGNNAGIIGAAMLDGMDR
ncbi:MAG: ROK family protein [Candidatus Pelethousia sp.]|nr:ROK family protein [Candidatus Pelethousia sp.]